MSKPFLYFGIAISLAFSITPALSAANTLTSEVLINANITGVADHKAIITHVKIPKGTPIPPHYHPTEEFLYLVQGEMILTIVGQADRHLKAGDSFKIPAKTVHTGASVADISEAIVFRVHPNGQPVIMAPPK
ncbi:MAG: cupin domain-containing protein [Kordiimonadaceae bacterium]|nr:cupin domain-containing protein [Kordiimonadaceae bacterium]